MTVDLRDGDPGDLGVYLHVPFCRARCSYCAFTTVPDDEQRRAAYVETLLEEIRQVAREGRELDGWHLPPQAGRLLATVYLGGGTPSLLASRDLERLLAALRDHHGLQQRAEVTLEANPETVTTEAARAWRAIGINRVSLGAQTFDRRVLRGLGRHHGPEEIVAAVDHLRRAGCDNLSLDLIAGVHPAGLPGDLEAAAALQPDHLSLYLLELDELEVGGRTALAAQVERGRWQAPDEDWFAQAYPAAVEALARHGLARYEISNFARPGRACRHNLRYWRAQEVLGLGVGAHSLVGGRRFANPADLDGYLRGLPRPILDAGGAELRAAEALFLGLRLDEGVDPADIGGRWGVVPPAGRKVEELMGSGLLRRRGLRWYLTKRGVLLSNEVFQSLLP